MKRRKEISIEVAPMWPEHMDAIEEIENECFEKKHIWSRKELEAARKKRYYLSRVAIITPKASRKKIIAGFLFVEQDKFRFSLLSMGVRKKWRRHGIGTAFLDYLIKKLRAEDHHEIYELVRETNRVAQEFYKAIGFVALKPKRNVFNETDEDAYPMIFKWEWSPQGRKENGDPRICIKPDRNHLCTCCGDCD